MCSSGLFWFRARSVCVSLLIRVLLLARVLSVSSVLLVCSLRAWEWGMSVGGRGDGPSCSYTGGGRLACCCLGVL